MAEIAPMSPESAPAGKPLKRLAHALPITNKMNAGAGRKRLETKAILTAGFTGVFNKYETKREMTACLDA